jgi:hypothetical protein
MNTTHTNLYIKTLSVYFIALILGAINLGPIGSLLKILGFIPVMICFLDHRGRYVVNKLIVSAFLFLSWTALSSLWSINAEDSLVRGLTQLSLFLMLISASTYTYTINDMNYLKKALIWSSRITLIVAFLFASTFQGRFWFTGIISEDPNYFCNYFAFGIVNCISVLCSEKFKLRYKFLLFIEFIAYLYIIIATGSRGGALAASVMIIIEYYNINKHRNLTLNTLVLRVFAIVLLLLSFNFIINFLSDEVLERFSLNVIESSDGTGRYEIWQDTINTYIDANIFRQLFGFGTGTAKIIASIFHFTYVNVIHNIYLENLIEVGMIGFILYIIYIFRYWNFARKADHYSFAIISGLMIMSLSTSMAAFKPYWNILIYITCISRLKIEKYKIF